MEMKEGKVIVLEGERQCREGVIQAKGARGGQGEELLTGAGREVAQTRRSNLGPFNEKGVQHVA